MADWKNLVRGTLRATTALAPVRVPLRGLTRAGLLPPAVWRRLPVDEKFPVTAPSGERFYYHATPHDVIGRQLYWRDLKHWEAETTAVFYTLAKQARLTLDVGANTGVFALLACAANPRGRVIAFEPVPQVYRKLAENIQINAWGDRCVARPEAVSNFIGKTQFHIPTEDVPTSGSLNTEGFRHFKGELVEVPVTTLDAVCPPGQRVDLMKIDVEGFEHLALDGARRVLAESAPTLILECLPDGPCEAMNAILSEYKYRFFHLRHDGPAAAPKITPDPTQEFRNYLCTVHEQWDRVGPA